MRFSAIIVFLSFYLFSSTFGAKCPSSINFLIGTYTKVSWLPNAKGTGVVQVLLRGKVLSVVTKFLPALTGHNPSYLTRSGQFLYMVNENAPQGSLTQVLFRNRAPYVTSLSVPTGDAGSTHVAIISNLRANTFVRRLVLVANYDGSVSSFVKATNSLYLADKFVIPKKLASAFRTNSQQSSPHPHMILPYKQNIVVPDLGSDLVWLLSVSRKNGKLAQITRVPMKKGDGPRHAALHRISDTVYVVNELSLTVAVLRPGCQRNVKLGLCYKRSLIADMNGAVGASAAAIRVSGNGKFLYASVRYPDTTEGKIVGFKLNKIGDIVTKLGEFSSGGVHPRDFMIVERVNLFGRCHSYIAVVNRDSNNLILIRRNFGSGRLFNEKHRLSVKVDTPVSVIV